MRHASKSVLTTVFLLAVTVASSVVDAKKRTNPAADNKNKTSICRLRSGDVMFDPKTERCDWTGVLPIALPPHMAPPPPRR